MFNKFKNTTNMNRIKQIFSLAIGLSLLVSCVDLDTAPRRYRYLRTETNGGRDEPGSY